MSIVTSPAVSRAAVTRRAEPVRPHLPVWPLYALFVGFPVWWVLGVGSFAVVLLALPMTLALVLRGQVRVPTYFWLWLVFIVFMLASAVQVDSPLRLVGFAMRAANYLGVTVLFVYLYNLPKERLPTRRVVYALLAYWAFVVVGGYLGLLLPYVSITTPLARVLPGPILANEYVQNLVKPPFAEVQLPYGAPAPFVRPSAPFAYTNGWGLAYALLLPVVLLSISQSRRGWPRRLLVGLLAASVLPAFATLNRGMFLAVGVSLIYVAVRLALRGQGRLLAVVTGVATVGVVVAGLLGVQNRIAERTTYSGTNSTRLALYNEAFVRTLHSPLLGYGAPRPSEEVYISVGTQGQFWNVMFSFGFVALAAFVGWIWLLAWRSRAARDPTTLWLHVLLVVASFTIFYYGYDSMQLSVLMVAAALLARPAAVEPAAAPAGPAAPRGASELSPS